MGVAEQQEVAAAEEMGWLVGVGEWGVGGVCTIRRDSWKKMQDKLDWLKRGRKEIGMNGKEQDAARAKS